ncbi:DUF6544 family protein [uncultured Croceitalea sp.]|uniref:DUF6544 family protein n=1 Tax=uncultured Croceitalea sp. TaxID=1798908 RepID=UPI003305C821
MALLVHLIGNTVPGLPKLLVYMIHSDFFALLADYFLAFVLVFVVFLLASAVFYAYYHFNASIDKDKELLFNMSGNTEKPVVRDDLQHLPELMRRFLLKVGVMGKCSDCHAIIKQSGHIRKTSQSNWTSFSAKQYMSSRPLGFVWAARSFPIFIKDKSIEGQGEMNVSFLAFYPMVVQQTSKTDESALVRCLGELLLYPIGFLNKDISWQSIDDKSVHAKLTQNGISAEGVFHFNNKGLIDHFVAKRYRDESLESFTGKLENYQEKSGLLIPTKLRAIWNLKEGDFEYFNCDIVDYRIE